MTKFYLEISNTDASDEWYWKVERIETISDTSIVQAGGCEPTSEQALGKAKAAMLDLRAEHARSRK
jgi:hypothetical protein